MSQTAPAQARTGCRPLRGILALLAALACLAGLAMAELKTSPSGPAASSGPAALPSGTVTPRVGTAAGRKTLIVAVTFGQPGTAGTILPNALQASHDLVLALDRALVPGGQSGSRHDS
jgi:hypothetical protein